MVVRVAGDRIAGMNTLSIVVVSVVLAVAFVASDLRWLKSIDLLRPPSPYGSLWGLLGRWSVPLGALAFATYVVASAFAWLNRPLVIPF
jgi:hypothetical protein